MLINSPLIKPHIAQIYTFKFTRLALFFALEILNSLRIALLNLTHTTSFCLLVALLNLLKKFLILKINLSHFKASDNKFRLSLT